MSNTKKRINRLEIEQQMRDQKIYAQAISSFFETLNNEDFEAFVEKRLANANEILGKFIGSLPMSEIFAVKRYLGRH